MQANLTLQPRLVASRPVTRRAPISRRQVTTRAAFETSIVISGATASALALGRFVFLPFQRDNINRQQPRQNDTPYPDAGDRLAQVSCTLASRAQTLKPFTYSRYAESMRDKAPHCINIQATCVMGTMRQLELDRCLRVEVASCRLCAPPEQFGR